MNRDIEFKTFEVKKDEWSSSRFVSETFTGNLEQDQVLLKIDRFALTTNNITYCAAGDILGYWGFFPAKEGFGRVPVMGYADVAASNHPDVQVGERLWGFYPMSNYLVVKAGRASKSSFFDVSEHRQQYAPIYCNYLRALANPYYEPQREDHDLLLRGLYLTSWLVEDFMFDNETFGADSYLITSASSKTSIALAFAVKSRGEKKAVGITSESNEAFCKNLGCYSEIITYDDVSSFDASESVVIVDMAGNVGVLRTLHERFQEKVKYSCLIGTTHIEESKGLLFITGLPGAKPELFFAPSHAQKRAEALGPGELEALIGQSLKDFQEYSDQWLTVMRASGPQAIESTFNKVLSGHALPSEGYILSV
jgi:hypothetical protein